MVSAPRPLLLAGLAGLVALAGLGAYAIGWPFAREATPSPTPVGIGITTADSSLLVRVADMEGFFADQGLDATVVPFELGRLATEAMFDGTLDLATTSQFAAARFGANRPNLRILASVDESVTTNLVARRDSGVISPRDLAGRRVGVTAGTSAEFFLVHFLLSNGLPPDSVEAVDLRPAALKEALYGRAIDAAVTWQPHQNEVMRRLGDNAIVLSDDHELPYFMLLVTTEEWLAANGESAVRLLRALAAADAFLHEDPDRARRYVSEPLDQDPAITGGAAGRFRLELRQGLLTTMEDQASWMREEGLIADVPNYLNHVHPGPLTDALPDAVSLFR